ncbi:MAG: hypothetical protein H7263_06860 [Candidatus Sericytochromatia bacterium]|nr:hypothetical protein [Candidatus Sericytochromatia bacterium]
MNKILKKTVYCSLIALIISSCNDAQVEQPFQNNNIKAFDATDLNIDVGAYKSYTVSKTDNLFLEDLSKRSFRFFVEHSDINTGLTLDRAATDGSPSKTNISSSAATGFALSAFCIAAQRGWIPNSEAQNRIRKTLKFLYEKAPQEHGWYLHFMDQKTGDRRWKSEYSTIDTALLLGGVLAARQYFKSDSEIYSLATKIYERVDFAWMMDKSTNLLSHGWTPEDGFIPYHWDTYSEHMILQILAIGSSTHPIPPEAWKAWKRTTTNYAGYTYLNSGPLFTHQYSPSYVDFRHRKDTNSDLQTDFFVNSVKATKAHKQFCLDISKQFSGYKENIWGITASDSAKGYLAWGGPPLTPDIDGTVVPCAAGGSLMFTPDITIPALQAMQHDFGNKIYGRYSFVDAFNPITGWVNPDVIGLDIGITLLSAENLRTGNIWKWFMQNPEIPRAMDLIGLQKY